MQKTSAELQAEFWKLEDESWSVYSLAIYELDSDVQM